jgi:shikimate kinase
VTVVLIGPPAAGKTRIGRRLAKRLDLPFVDTDQVIVAGHGSIAEIFARDGEAAFRAIEREVVHTAIAAGGVVSLGGGAVLDERTQADLKGHAVVLLTVSADAVATRIADARRPLVPNPDAWRALVARRMPLYESLAGLEADTSHRPASAIVEEIAQWCEWKEHTAHE